MTPAAPPLIDHGATEPLSPRWWWDLEWLCGETLDPTPAQTLQRLARRLARADPHDPAEIAWLVERAAEIVADATA